MSALLLREAAGALRNPYRFNGNAYEPALSDWLDVCADRVEEVWGTITNQRVRDEATPGIVLGYTEALTVARLILGREAPS